MTPTPEPATLFHPEVEVRVSPRRKKTAGAHWEGDRIVVVVPTHLRGAERDDMVDHLTRRLTRHRPHLHTSDDELAARARQLGPHLPRRRGAGLDPLGHQPDQALGIVHAGHPGDPHLVPAAGGARRGCSTR